MWNPFDFTDKKIIVTGATSGIGKATALKLAEQRAQVYLIGRNTEKLATVIEQLPGAGHHYYVKDFKESGGYKELFDDIVKDGCKISGIVHCAGIAKIVPLNMLSVKYMDESMSVNFYPLVEMTRLLAKKKYHDQASIVGVSSISVQYPKKCQGIYVATKSAMNAMVQSLALELAEKNIRINTVLPASTNTQMLKQSAENLTEKQLRAELDKQALGLEEPEDIADIILFLLSDASRMITGRYIYADGGYLDF